MMEKFKVGDWVTINSGSPHQFKRFTKDLPEWNKSLEYENIEMLCGARFHIPNFDRSIVELWQPKEGEWCWFAFDIDDRPFLSQFSHITKNEQIGNKLISIGYHDIVGNLPKTICEPFIGELPSFLKDNA